MILACLLGVGCALGGAPVSDGRLAAGEPAAGVEASEVWRTASHDGANCLYLLLTLSGRKADYQQVTAALQESGRGENLAGLREAAHHLGLDVSVYQWGPRRLANAPGPVIAYMDSYKGEGGYFTLVFQATELNCYLIRGSSASIQELGVDDFRRAWSGYVLAPTEPPPSRMPELLSCGVGVLFLAGYGWFRARPTLATLPAGAQPQVP